MAGIGFVLKKLTEKDDLLGIFRAFTHSAVASCGPWLFTVLALAAISMLFPEMYVSEDTLNFREIVVYNFSISLVLSAPIYMVITRYLADALHRKNVTFTITVLMQGMGMLYAILVPVGILFYFSYTELDLDMRLSGFVNLLLIGPIWLIGVFVLGLKDYVGVTRAFGVGMLIAFFAAQWLKSDYGATGLLNGFNLGLGYILFAQIAKVLAEYPYPLTGPTKLHLYFRRYWELAVAGVFYNAGFWVDKWLMWFLAPEHITLPSNLRYFPAYDSATFLAYLTIVPAMALFVFSVETHFFVRYQRFYYDILEHRTLQKIRENHQKLINSIMESTRNFIVLQGSITVIAILFSARLFEWLDISFLELGIFRLSTLGAFFQAMMLFELVILAYFDCRRIMMVLQGIFLLTNAVFTYVTIEWLGFAYYGFGYFLACLVTFLFTSIVLFNHIRMLPYHAFITNNNSLRPSFKGIDEE